MGHYRYWMMAAAVPLGMAGADVAYAAKPVSAPVSTRASDDCSDRCAHARKPIKPKSQRRYILM